VPGVKKASKLPAGIPVVSAILPPGSAAQSGGSSCVSVLMMRRFWSAAVVRSEAFQSQSATRMTNARTSAVALNAPRPAHLARKIACRFTSGERPCAGVSPSARGYAEGGADHHYLRAFAWATAAVMRARNTSTTCETLRAFSRPLARAAPIRAWCSGSKPRWARTTPPARAHRSKGQDARAGTRAQRRATGARRQRRDRVAPKKGLGDVQSVEPTGPASTGFATDSPLEGGILCQIQK